MNNIYITKTFIEDRDQSELDFDLQDGFGFDYEDNSRFIEIPKNGHGSANATPMKIDDMISILTQLKEKGSTHIQIEDHCDHHGYDISGYQIRKSTSEEITEYENKLNSKKEKEEKIVNLYKQINEIKRS